MVKSENFRAQGGAGNGSGAQGGAGNGSGAQGASEKSRSEYGKVSKKLPEQESSGRELQKGDIRLCRNAKNGEPASRRWVRGGRTSDFP